MDEVRTKIGVKSDWKKSGRWQSIDPLEEGPPFLPDFDLFVTLLPSKPSFFQTHPDSGPLETVGGRGWRILRATDQEKLTQVIRKGTRFIGK